MKRMNQFVAFVLVVCLAFTFGCEKDSNDGKAPQLPPLSTFVTDFSEFEDGVPMLKATQEFTNFQLAALTVWYTNFNLTIGLAIPVASYIEAHNHEPVRVDNDTWQWTYDVEVQQVTYTAQLTADVVEDMVNWEMRISQDQGFQDYLWYSGTSNIIGTEGTWTLYDGPEGEDLEYLDIDWTVDYEAETFDVTYTIVYASHEYIDSYINYGITNDDPNYDVYYNVYDSTEETSLYKVYYNTETHVGKYQEYVSDELYYEGCWDENFDDADCPS